MHHPFSDGAQHLEVREQHGVHPHYADGSRYLEEIIVRLLRIYIQLLMITILAEMPFPIMKNSLG